jgi:outer membrane biosynthesis protein TonB
VPFESVLQANQGGGFRRSATVIVSLAAHVVVLGGWAIRSFWTVDELAPPTTAVILHLHATPPPAPSMKVAGGGQARPTTEGRTSAPARRPAPRSVPRPVETPVAAAPITQPAPPVPSAPPAEPVKEAAPAASSGSGAGQGGPGSVAGGVGSGNGAGPGSGTNGVVGGIGAGPPPKFLPEALAKTQRIGGVEPTFPPSLARAGVTYVVQAKICVGPDGKVDRVNVVKADEPTLDGNVISAVRGWRYRPLLAAGAPVPFCTFVRFEFRGE